MAFKVSPLFFLIFSVFFMQCLQVTEGHLIKKHGGPNHNPSGKNKSISENNPELTMFFHYNNLKVGTKLPFYFPTKDPSTSPHLLSKHESNSIPFTTSQFESVLEFFSFTETSKQALAMKTTLQHCEYPPNKDETKFCATSLESMLDSIRAIFGFNSKFKIITTKYLSNSISSIPLQDYTIIEPPTRISARKIMACHLLPYPYAVFYCHGQESDTKLYKVLLAAEDGGRVEAAAICHMDTTEWDPHHVAFRVLGTEPGGLPICHVFPMDNLVWVTL
ncbi:hypothetical protein CASFOL_004803 [Castilleja foliolosa]|uniref:BURP domain-containing protein n=1 Tax=Castilleja foliolosa TaxID=1961234 RepID=A0ABD3EBN6_9LAMI